MTGQKRPLDSGRKDSKGRTVKVAAGTADARSSAPPPPAGDGWEAEAHAILSGRPDRVNAAADWKVRNAVEEQIAGEYVAVVGVSAERAEAEIAAAKARVAEAERDLNRAKKWAELADRALAVSQRAELTATFETAVNERDRALHELEAAYNTLQVAGHPARGLAALVERQVPLGDQLAQFDRLQESLRTAQLAVSRAHDPARKANGWAWDGPENARAYEPVRSNEWGRESSRSEDIGYTVRLAAMVERMAAQDAAIPAGSSMLPRATAAFRRSIADGIRQVDRNGVGDYQGLPCTQCGDPMYGTNDETYFCRSCH